MKHLLIILLFISANSQCFSQEEKTPFFNMSDHIGGFGGVELTMNNDLKFNVSGEGAFLFRNFYVGGFGGGASYDDQLSSIDNYYYNLSSGMGGFSLGAYSNTHNFLALFVETKFGFGEALARRNLSASIYEEYSHSLFAFIPKIGLSINPIKPMQIRIDAAYQLTNSFDLNGISNEAFEGIVFGIGLYLGYF